MRQKGNMYKHYASGTFIYRKILNLAMLLPKTHRHATVNQDRINTTVSLQCFSTCCYGNTKIIQGLLNIRYTYVNYNFLLGPMLLDGRLIHRKKQLVKPTIPSQFVLKNVRFLRQFDQPLVSSTSQLSVYFSVMIN